MVARLGETELSVVRHVMHGSVSTSRAESVRVRLRAKLNAGIWPPTGRVLAEFAHTYTRAFEGASVVAMWQTLEGELRFVRRWTSDEAIRVPLETLDPVRLAAKGVAPWSRALEGRSVLVVAPFASIATSQAKRFHSLFNSDAKILPACNILGVCPPQTHALQMSRSSWIDSLENLKRRVDGMQRNFDVALVAAGSYGMPISAHIQQLGKPTVYMGGCLQLLFGIDGARWRHDAGVQGLRTSEWITASRSDRPFGSRLIEGGAYW